jgi:ribosomal RNA-processing protein 36
VLLCNFSFDLCINSLACSGGIPTALHQRKHESPPSPFHPFPCCREARDPRFEDPLSSGAARAEELAKFKSRYSFLYDEQLPAERKELAVAVKKTKSLARKVELQAELAAVNAQLRAEGERRKRDTSARQVKAREREAVKAGKAPFYLKKSERKRQELISKFEALKAAGQLDRYMEKRRKKNAAKDHRYLPSSRRVQE